ncbi:MAG: HNH endonuclease [Eubacteriales bacterium]|nr:HNH endonuclease [Eubacteriales bacterium]
MQMYVGVTDKTQYELLKKEQCSEVNFWTPGNANFRAIRENDIFLFKLHSPDDYIVGGGYFVHFSILPTHLAWTIFGKKNGANSLPEFYEKITKYRNKNGILKESPQIGCIILTDAFYFDEKDWIPIPENWNRNIVSGKTYNEKDVYGKTLYEAVKQRLGEKAHPDNRNANPLFQHEIGDGAFQAMVTDAYQKRCAITGEPVLPILQATHIKPPAAGGTNTVNNGLLLKSDFRMLFDAGYITVDWHYRVKVSKRLCQDYGGGEMYYAYQDRQLLLIPDQIMHLPLREYLEWHNENVFLG